MNVETFFEKFNQFADAPDAVAKMRNLVLNLAVQGKLVPQNPEDEPADQLLKRTASQQEKLRKNRPKTTLEESLHPFDLPKGWTWATFPALGEFGRGKSKHRPRNDPSLYHAGTYKLVQTGDVARANGEVQTYTALYNDTGLAQSRLWPKGTMCITIAANIADSGILGFDACFPDSVVGFIPHDDLPSVQYFEYFLRTAKDHLEKYAPSTAQKNINLGILEQVMIPLPPAAEQSRIVAKVDELMALCDRLEAQQQERDTQQAALARASLARFADAPTPANLNFLFHSSYHIPPADLQKSILSLAVQGKLVPQDPNDERIERVLAEMRSRREELIASGEIREPKKQPAVSAKQAPFELPDGWLWERWGNICDWITYGFTKPMAHVDSGPPIITAKNVRNGFLDLENTHYAEENEFAALRPKDRPKKGDILIVKDGATIGRAAMVDFSDSFCISQTVAVLWRRSCLLHGAFLLMLIRSPFTQEMIWSKAEGAAMPHLSITDFAELIIPIPPVSEQRRIVAKVDQLMALVDELQTQLTESRATAKNLLEALVAELTVSRS